MNTAIENETAFKRPVPVTILGCLFIGAGLVGLAYHLSDRPLEAWILVLRVLAIVGGVGLLLRQSWARWLTLTWLAFHVVLSAFHSLSEFLAHLVLLLVIAYVLLRPPASQYFRSSSLQQSH
jgi:hypothetical protein